MKKKNLAFGEILWDLLPTGPKLGGAPCNFAYRVNCLGDEGILVSRIGRDELGKRILDRVTSLGMETTYLQIDPVHPTGTVPITLDAKQTPDFTILPNVAYDFIEVNDSLLNLASGIDCLCFGTLVQRAPTSRNTLQRLIEVSASSIKLLDINLRKDCYTLDSIISSLQTADILKLNEDEAKYLTDRLGMSARSIPDFCAAMIQQWSLTHCLVTLGERGSFAASKDREKVYVPGYRVNVIDTCGSGDAFTAGWICRFMKDRELVECCRVGNALGAMTAAQPGATEPITPNDLERFLETDGERIIEDSLAAFLKD